MSTPVCELYAGKEHQANPPAAVGRFLIKWVTAPGGEQRRHVTNMCRPCYDSKAAEIIELVREGGIRAWGDNCVEVIQRYDGGRRLPVHAGRDAVRN
jgi:hypothetical protein